jgi:hypothetical protein
MLLRLYIRIIFSKVKTQFPPWKGVHAKFAPNMARTRENTLLDAVHQAVINYIKLW